MKYWLCLLVALQSMHGFARSDYDTLVAYPNPFETILNIQFDLSTPDTVSLTLFNTMGQAADVILDEAFLPSGPHLYYYNGSALDPGIYMLELKLSTETYHQKVVKSNTLNAIEPRQAGLILSPNPTAGYLNIPLEGKKTVTIFHQGVLVRTFQTSDSGFYLEPNQPLFDLPWSSGFYVVTIHDATNRLITTQKIIKTP